MGSSTDPHRYVVAGSQDHYQQSLPVSLYHDQPLPDVQNSVALVTGTLGLSFPQTAAAMRKAVGYARSGPCSVLVDINWRPVFWESLTPQAVEIVSEYAGGADILKLSEEEAEWLYGVHSDQAMSQPDLVRLPAFIPLFTVCLFLLSFAAELYASHSADWTMTVA